MTYLLRLMAASLLLVFANAHAKVDVSGVLFEEREIVAGETLALNGAGVRTRVVFKVYAMGLYLPQRADQPNAVVAMPGAKRIRIVTLRDLTSSQFVDALVEGLARNHDTQTLEALGPAIDAFRGAMLALDRAPSGTEVLIDWIPSSGTRLSVGGARQGYDIADEAFYQALLRVWLGEQPADRELKRGLLGAAR